MAANEVPGTVELAWDANPESDIAGYRVHYGTTSGNLDRIATIGTTPTATLSGLEPGALYHCAVLAFNTAGLESALSSEIAFVAPGAGTFPEISVERASGSVLTAGQTAVSLAKVDLGSTGAAETFFIRNLGTGYLTGLAIATDGDEFTVTSLGTSTLAPGETTSFNVTFRPIAPGNRVAVIHITSNDVDENPFDIGLVARGVAVPEIAIQHPFGPDLIDSYATINFSNSLLGTTGTAETFTLKNTGTADLTGLAISASGTGSGDFILGAPAVSILAPGASVTFTIAFRPSLPGIRAASVHITSNDADESPFDIALTGTGTGIAFPDISITQAGGSGLIGGLSSVNLGSVNLGSVGIAQTFTIANLGTGSLSDLGIAVHGVHHSDFLVESMTTNSLPQGASTTFKVTFKPTVAGARTATLHITSNDPDENPIYIDLSGNGIAFPVMALESTNGTPIANSGAVIQFGSLNVGTTGSPTVYTVRNTGTSPLTGLQITLTGAEESSFLLTAPATTTLAPGASTTFRVSFRPTTGGPKVASFQIASDSTATGLLVVALKGNGIDFPEITVLSDAADLTSGSATLNLGDCDLGATTPTRSITIKNSGTAALTGLAVASSSGFSAGSLGATTLAPGAITTFKVSFAPSAVGARVATLAISSNDADESPFLITLTGTGTAAPEIVAEQSNGKTLVDANTFINFGTMNVGTTAKTQTFTIRNTGTAVLTGLTFLKNGIHPGDFTVTGLKTESLAPGASTTFKVAFKSSKVGTRWAAIHIISNDADESSFDIVLTGTGRKSQTTKTAATKTRLANHAEAAAPPVTGLAVIDGRKYRTLTLTKTTGMTILPRDIEVSSDLVAWASGNQHTTILLNTANTLMVRDNTPLPQDANRYIRLKQ